MSMFVIELSLPFKNKHTNNMFLDILQHKFFYVGIIDIDSLPFIFLYATLDFTEQPL